MATVEYSHPPSPPHPQLHLPSLHLLSQRKLYIELDRGYFSIPELELANLTRQKQSEEETTDIIEIKGVESGKVKQGFGTEKDPINLLSASTGQFSAIVRLRPASEGVLFRFTASVSI